VKAQTPREIAEAVCDYYCKNNITFNVTDMGAATKIIYLHNSKYT
jgi:hypothetical protein